MEIETWRDLRDKLNQLTEEQLNQRVQVVKSHPVEDFVIPLEPAIALATIDELELIYTRSSIDNRHHGDAVVLFTDSNPHAINGATAYEWHADGRETPLYHKDHDDSCDWTGPAQKLLDESRKNPIVRGISKSESLLIEQRLKDVSLDDTTS